MSELLIHSTSTAQWQALVLEAQQHSSVKLDEDMESYLVFLLMRFTKKPEMASSVIGLEFLNGFQGSHSRCQPDHLRDVGDKCLLLAGLFPDRAQKRKLSVNYFVNIGKSAYLTLSDSLFREQAQLFETLCDSFIKLTDVLQATREVQQVNTDNLMQAIDLWVNNQSEYAFNKLVNHTNGLPIQLPKDESRH